LDENYNVKIADFGLSNIMTDGDFLKTSCGMFIFLQKWIKKKKKKKKKNRIIIIIIIMKLKIFND